jgi:hypothetical protein
MKKQILYFITGAFLSLAIVAFWAFKKDKYETAGGNYAAVEFSISVVTIALGDGKIETKKFNKSTPEEIADIINEMGAKGYSFVELTSPGLTTHEIIFKKL